MAISCAFRLPVNQCGFCLLPRLLFCCHHAARFALKPYAMNSRDKRQPPPGFGGFRVSHEGPPCPAACPRLFNRSRERSSTQAVGLAQASGCVVAHARFSAQQRQAYCWSSCCCSLSSQTPCSAQPACSIGWQPGCAPAHRGPQSSSASVSPSAWLGRWSQGSRCSRCCGACRCPLCCCPCQCACCASDCGQATLTCSSCSRDRQRSQRAQRSGRCRFRGPRACSTSGSHSELQPAARGHCNGCSLAGSCTRLGGRSATLCWFAPGSQAWVCTARCS